MSETNEQVSTETPEVDVLQAQKLFVGNLNYGTTEETLEKEFSAAGQVVKVNIIMLSKQKRSAGYGFVVMGSEEEAKQAVALLDKKEVDGRSINVEASDPSKRNPRKQRNASKNAGENQSSEQADANSTKKTTRSRRRRQKQLGEPTETKVICQNLPYSLTDETLGAVFTEAGLPVEESSVIKKRNGLSFGFGFVTFPTKEDREKALALNGKDVEGRKISVKVALKEISTAESTPVASQEDGEKETSQES